MAVSVTASRYTLYNKKKLNTDHARVLYCAREEFSLHHHIQAGSGVYVLFYIYYASRDSIIGVKMAGARLRSRNFVCCNIQVRGHKAIADHKHRNKQTNRKRNTNTTIQTT